MMDEDIQNLDLDEYCRELLEGLAAGRYKHLPEEHRKAKYAIVALVYKVFGEFGISYFLAFCSFLSGKFFASFFNFETVVSLYFFSFCAACVWTSLVVLSVVISSISGQQNANKTE